MEDTLGLLLMTYGSPETLDDVEEYLTNVRGGRSPDPELVEEFRERYQIIGGSPLLEITREQARRSAQKLESILGNVSVKPYVGMRFFRPYIPDTVSRMVQEGIERGVALILSPQYSSILMGGYEDDLQEGIEQTNGSLDIEMVQEWYDEPLYHRAVAARIKEKLDELPEDIRHDVPLLLTAHSIPKRVADKNPDYVDQLKTTADRVASYLDHDHWEFAYQSAGHTQEEWLTPDMTDLFPGFAEEGHEHVVIAPFQFLADHLEILYDIDVAARKQAEEGGLTFHRIESLNTHPLFMEALAHIAHGKLESAGDPTGTR